MGFCLLTHTIGGGLGICLVVTKGGYAALPLQL